MLSPARCFLHRPLTRHVSTPRRGRNLTDRYRTLENSNRAKSEHATHVSLLASTAALQSDAALLARRPTTAPKTIAGFVVPEEPRAPADDGMLYVFCLSLSLTLDIECCMSGCAVCVYDLYEEALAAYKDSVVTLRTALSALHVPETEWPAHIRTGASTETHTSPTPTTGGKSKDVVLGAFEEMERALKEKREKRGAVEAQSSS
ncbi:hypothetical protein J3R83DRAFT_10665 [Lanmaoa asiatica]|nr:hypothetical protein J3R83DRAFT_10665 [Lanmaoa asiatica]